MDKERENDKEAFKIIIQKKVKKKKFRNYLQPLNNVYEDPKDNLKQLVDMTYKHWYKEEFKGKGKR